MTSAGGGEGAGPNKGRSRRGQPDKHLNLNVRGMSTSATVAINDRSNRLKAEGRTVYKLGLGQSPFPVPPSVVEALRTHAHEKDYLPTAGLGELREAVATYTKRTAGVDRRADDVLVGPGSKELMFLLQLVFYGDLVIPTPSWVSYAPQARIIGRQVRFIPTKREGLWRLGPEDLERICAEDEGRPRLFILNYPSNPTGGTYKVDELKQLAKVAARHRVLLLSDEIYGELHHKGQHVSIARFYPEGTIVSAGLSKWCGAGGWRLGTFVFPPNLRWLLEAMAAAASETYTSTAAPIQYAAITAFQGGPAIDSYLQASRRLLGALGRWCARMLESAGVRCLPPAGGFYLFPDFTELRGPLLDRGIRSSRALAERILEDTGVAILPGEAFGRAPEELTARVAYVDFDGARALEAVQAVPKDAPLEEAFLQKECPLVVEAAKRVVDWLPSTR